ncbi:hypothetical protein Q7P37_010445 [Cladosporium fusiforme]
MATAGCPQAMTIAKFLDAPSTSPTIVRGSVDSVYREGEASTIVIHDGSTIRQLPVRLSGHQTVIDSLISWTVVEFSGLRGSSLEHSCELQATNLRILGHSDSSNPLNHGSAAALAHPHLRLRTLWHGLLMRFRSATTAAITDYFLHHPGGSFHQVHHHVITWTDCEGGAEVFPVLTQNSKQQTAALKDDYFGARRYLTVTAAIHGEAFAMGLDRIWMLAPSFRAERVVDDRHLAEFTMLEIAMNYVESLDPLLELCEDFTRGLVERLRQSKVGEELLANVGRPETTPVTRDELEARWKLLTDPNWPRVTHAEAVDMMVAAESDGQVKFQQTPGPEIDFSTEHEMFILEHFKRPVFVTHYPTKIRLFSAMQSPCPSPGGIQTTESVDLLLPGQAEIFSGGLREHRLDKLVEVLRAKQFFKPSETCEPTGGMGNSGSYPHLRHNESLNSLEWFADLRRYGTSPHGGFGIGFERLLVYLTGAQSTKDVIDFPRYYQSCEA